MVGHFSAIASNISWVVRRSHMMPQYIRMHLNLLNSVAHKLPVLSCASYPVQGNRAIKPTFTTMWPDTNSNWGIVNTLFTNLALEGTSPRLTPFSCTTTAYAAAATPFPLASLKACNSMAWCVNQSWCATNDPGTVIWLGSFSSQQTLLSWQFYIARCHGVWLVTLAPVDRISWWLYWEFLAFFGLVLYDGKVTQMVLL